MGDEDEYREDEVKSHFKHLCEELDSPPHHFEVIRSSKKFLAGEISS